MPKTNFQVLTPPESIDTTKKPNLQSAKCLPGRSQAERVPGSRISACSGPGVVSEQRLGDFNRTQNNNSKRSVGQAIPAPPFSAKGPTTTPVKLLQSRNPSSIRPSQAGEIARDASRLGVIMPAASIISSPTQSASMKSVEKASKITRNAFLGESGIKLVANSHNPSQGPHDLNRMPLANSRDTHRTILHPCLPSIYRIARTQGKLRNQLRCRYQSNQHRDQHGILARSRSQD